MAQNQRKRKRSPENGTHDDTQNGTHNFTADIIIVGGGFGGCYALHALRKAGYSIKLIEAGSDFGGVWHFNRYPGARVDSEIPLYQLNIPEVWRSFTWSERFPGHEEIRAYFEHMSKTLDLHKDAIFNTRVTGAQYDPKSTRWTIKTNTGIEALSQYVVFATGTTNKAYIPNFPGLDDFAGEVIHPCRWPEELDLRGKKVGIVGQGASGLQILQEVAKEEVGADVTVFLRNPSTALPMQQRAISPAESMEQKNAYQVFFKHAKYEDESGYAYNPPCDSYQQTTLEERRQYYRELWERGSYAVLRTNYQEFSSDTAANAELYQFWAETVRARISDPVKRDIMAPLKQFQWIGTKRPNLEMDYYEMIDRPNVKLVNLKEDAIHTFTKTGVTTKGPKGETEHELDIVIMATGYDSVTGSLYDMNIVGGDGVKLQDRWAKSIKTYLGMVTPGFPNMFMLYGPQAPSGLANGAVFLELEVDWVVQFLAKLRAEKATTFEVKQDASVAYVQRNLDKFNGSLSKETPSWWNGANIPGKTREPLFWMCGLQSWRKETETALQDWSKFELS